MGKAGKGVEGFSLIELVIVVSVLSILAAVIAPQVNKILTKSKISRLESELKTLKTACNTVYADVGFFPAEVDENTDPGLVSSSNVPADDQSNWLGPYMDRWPTSHPWGGSYDYNYGQYNNFNYDGSSGNEVYVTVSEDLTRDILEKIDADLDDGIRNAGNIRHNGSNTLVYYIGEGPAWGS
jgi:general secretion pathway protein G